MNNHLPLPIKNNKLKIIPIYRSNFNNSCNSVADPVNEWTTPEGNLCQFSLIIYIKSYSHALECKYIGNLYFSAKSKCIGKTLKI